MNNQVTEKQQMVENLIQETKKKIDYMTVEYPLEFFPEIISQEKIEQKLHWKIEQQSLFIESLLLGLPMLTLIIQGSVEEYYEIIDGKQRLYTAINFVKGNLQLENLKLLPSLNGFTFNDLLPNRKRRFKRNTVRIIQLSPDSNVFFWT